MSRVYISDCVHYTKGAALVPAVPSAFGTTLNRVHNIHKMQMIKHPFFLHFHQASCNTRHPPGTSYSCDKCHAVNQPRRPYNTDSAAGTDLIMATITYRKTTCMYRLACFARTTLCSCWDSRDAVTVLIRLQYLNWTWAFSQKSAVGFWVWFLPALRRHHDVSHFDAHPLVLL